MNENKNKNAEENPIENSHTEIKTKVKMTLKEKIILIRNNITVEPALALYIFPFMVSSMATQNLNLEKICRVNLNFTTEICDALTRRETENYTYYEDQVQIYMANIVTWKSLIESTLPTFIVMFVGAWSDKTGKRKACIMMPMIGGFLAILGLIINTYFFYELRAEVTALTEVLIPSLCGGWYTHYIGVFSYIGDITTVETRTFRVGAANVFSQLGIPIGSALSGVLLRWLGYYGVFFISASLSLLGIFFAARLEDPKRNIVVVSNNKGVFGFFREFFDIKLFVETIKVAFKDGPGKRRLRVCLLIIVICVIFGPSNGEWTILYLFARFKFNWDEVQYSYWTTFCMVTSLLGTIFSLNFFTKYLKLDDTVLGIISNVSKVVASFGYAFARNSLELYMASILEMLNGTSFIAIRSIASKLVTGDEFGKVNSLFALAEAMVPLMYNPLYTSVYKRSFKVFPGAIFLLSAGLTLPSIMIFSWLYFQQRKYGIQIKSEKPIEAELKPLKEDQDNKTDAKTENP